MKSWIERHPVLIGFLSYIVFLAVAFTLAPFVSSLFYLLLIPAFASLIGSFIFARKWEWVCSKCGWREWGTREKYCEKCGAEMILKRKKVKVKYCERGHRIKDEWNSVVVCPKCGSPLVKEKIEPI